MRKRLNVICIGTAFVVTYHCRLSAVFTFSRMNLLLIKVNKMISYLTLIRVESSWHSFAT